MMVSRASLLREGTSLANPERLLRTLEWKKQQDLRWRVIPCIIHKDNISPKQGRMHFAVSDPLWTKRCVVTRKLKDDRKQYEVIARLAPIVNLRRVILHEQEIASCTKKDQSGDLNMLNLLILNATKGKADRKSRLMPSERRLHVGDEASATKSDIGKGRGKLRWLLPTHLFACVKEELLTS